MPILLVPIFMVTISGFIPFNGLGQYCSRSLGVGHGYILLQHGRISGIRLIYLYLIRPHILSNRVNTYFHYL